MQTNGAPSFFSSSPSSPMAENIPALLRPLAGTKITPFALHRHVASSRTKSTKCNETSDGQDGASAYQQWGCKLTYATLRLDSGLHYKNSTVWTSPRCPTLLGAQNMSGWQIITSAMSGSHLSELPHRCSHYILEKQIHRDGTTSR